MVDRSQIPAGLLPLIGADNLEEVLQQRHPEFETGVADWKVMIDAFEGTGGFRDGGYLFAFPRESHSDYVRRQASARWHNYVAPIVDLYIRLLYTQSVKRTSNNPDYNAWLANVDGAGHDMNFLLKQLVALSLVTGHAGVLIDKTSEEAFGPAKADERARVVAHPFTSTAIADWTFDGPRMSSVKLIEPALRRSITELPSKEAPALNYLIWTDEGWVRLDDQGVLLGAGVLNIGLVPFVVLRAAPTYFSSMTGRPVAGSPNIVRAIYNRCSEEDQVLRDQAFSVLAISVGPDGNVDRAREQLGQTIGTASALVVQGDIKYATPDQSVPGTIRENITYLVQELYRTAHIRYSRDSSLAESGESIRLQHTELNEMLQGLAHALQDVEQGMARAWFAWQYPTPELAEQAYQAAQPEANYPAEFIDGDLSADLEALAEGIRLDLGPTMTKRIKKQSVRRIDPDIPAAELKQIDAEIDAQESPELPTVPLDHGDPVGAGIQRALLQ